MRAASLIVLVACQTQGTAAPNGAAEVVMRDEAGDAILTVTRTATGCVTDKALAITVAGARVSAGAWTLDAGATGRELRGPQGLIARVVGGAPRLSLIDDIGVPMAHVAFEDGFAVITSSARSEIGTVVSKDGTFTLLAGETPVSTVTGTTDLELAARLVVPAPLSSEARALLACERLAAITPAVK